MTIIDFHTHLDDHWFGQVVPTEDQFLDALDRFDVCTACISTLMGFYGDSARYNDALAERGRRHPERLAPFATVDPKLGSEAVEELERCLSDPIFRGVKLHPWLQSFASTMVRDTMVELLMCAARHKTPVMFHDGTPPYATTFQVAALARWVPEATIVLGHAGLADYVDVAARLVHELPNLYACVCGPRAGEVRHLVETAGVDKVVFGSDFGFADWTILGEFLDNVLESGLDQRSLEQLLYNNAARLLRLDECPLTENVDFGHGSEILRKKTE